MNEKDKDFFLRLVKNKHRLNENQRNFVDTSIDILRQIDPPNIAQNSFIGFKQEVLIISLIHSLDRFAGVKIEIDEKDIVITSVFMIDSLRYQFPHLKGEKFYQAAAGYLETVLRGGFQKVFYYTPKGKVFKAELNWPDKTFKNRVYISLFNLLKSILFRPKLTHRSFEYVSFIQNTREPPVNLVL